MLVGVGPWSAERRWSTVKAWQLHLILRELKKQRPPDPRVQHLLQRSQAEIDADPWVQRHRRNQAAKLARQQRRAERRERRRAK